MTFLPTRGTSQKNGLPPAHAGTATYYKGIQNYSINYSTAGKVVIFTGKS